MEPVVVKNSWFKQIVDHSEIVELAATPKISEPLLLRDVSPGFFLDRIVFKQTERFAGTGIGIVMADVIDEYGKSVLATKARIGLLQNTYSSFSIQAAAVVPNILLNTAPDKLYLQLSTEEAGNTYERTLVTAIASSVGASLSAKYFLISDTKYVWYNTGASVDPEPGSLTSGDGYEVSINTTETAAEVARKTYNVLFGKSNLITGYNGTTGLIICDTTAANVVNSSAGDSGFTVTIEQAGGAAPAGLDDLSSGTVEIYLNFLKVF